MIVAGVFIKINWDKDNKKRMHGSGQSSGCMWNNLADKKSSLLTALCSG